MNIGGQARTWAVVAVAVAVVIALVISSTRRGRAPSEPTSTFVPASGGSGVEPLPSWRIRHDQNLPPVPKPPKSALMPDAGRPQVFDVGFHPGDGPLVRPMDKDIFPKQPYRVDIFRDGPDGLFTKVMIDMNRNGKWEEMWTLTDQEVFRKYSINDNGSYRDFTTLEMGRWKPNGGL